MEKTYDIAQAARFIGVSASTLRYWEDEGLIRAQRDARNGYRRYTLHDLMEAGEVAFYREMGVSVKALKGYRDFSTARFDDILIAARSAVEARIEELERMRERVDFQLELNERFRRLSDRALRASSPSVARLVEIDYDSESQWNLLVDDASRYGVFVDASRPLEPVEAVVERSTREDARRRGCSGGCDGAAAPSAASRAEGDGDGCGLLWRLEDAPADAVWFECLFKCSIDRGESNACKLFAKARAEGFEPLSLVGRYLLTASDGMRWDWYQCWVECVRA